MSPEIRARAMEPFFTTKEVGRGTGLGLAQVYGIARQSGGDVRIESTPGQGTTVSILLPAAGARPAGEEIAASDSPGELVTGVVPEARVLVVDDDDDVRATFVTALEEPGYAPLEASSGEAALQIIRTDPTIAAAIFDFAMPGMNGAVLAERTRRDRPGLPILIASGYADTEALDRVPDAPILRKPIRIAELADALRRAMRPCRQRASAPADQASAGMSSSRASV